VIVHTDTPFDDISTGHSGGVAFYDSILLLQSGKLAVRMADRVAIAPLTSPMPVPGAVGVAVLWGGEDVND
jgi:hypothetical protein